MPVSLCACSHNLSLMPRLSSWVSPGPSSRACNHGGRRNGLAKSRPLSSSCLGEHLVLRVATLTPFSTTLCCDLQLGTVRAVTMARHGRPLRPAAADALELKPPTRPSHTAPQVEAAIIADRYLSRHHLNGRSIADSYFSTGELIVVFSMRGVDLATTMRHLDALAAASLHHKTPRSGCPANLVSSALQAKGLCVCRRSVPAMASLLRLSPLRA